MPIERSKLNRLLAGFVGAPLAVGAFALSAGIASSASAEELEEVVDSRGLEWVRVDSEVRRNSEPELEERKRMGVMVMIFLAIFTILLFLSKRKIWARLH